MVYSERVKLLYEMTKDVSLRSIGKFLLKDLNERIDPSQLLSLDIIAQISQTLGIQNPQSSKKTVSISFELLALGSGILSTLF